MSQQTGPVASVFAVAESIVKELKKLHDKQEQVEAIRFANQHLKLDAPSHIPDSAAPSVQPTTAVSPQLSSAQGHSMDIKTFTTEKKPKTHIQFAALVAYFYRYEAPEGQRKETIRAGDLREAVRLAGWKGLTKPNPTLNNAKAAGYLDAAGGGQFSTRLPLFAVGHGETGLKRSGVT